MYCNNLSSRPILGVCAHPWHVISAAAGPTPLLCRCCQGTHAVGHGPALSFKVTPGLTPGALVPFYLSSGPKQVSGVLRYTSSAGRGWECNRCCRGAAPPGQAAPLASGAAHFLAAILRSSAAISSRLALPRLWVPSCKSARGRRGTQAGEVASAGGMAIGQNRALEEAGGCGGRQARSVRHVWLRRAGPEAPACPAALPARAPGSLLVLLASATGADLVLAPGLVLRAGRQAHALSALRSTWHAARGSAHMCRCLPQCFALLQTRSAGWATGGSAHAGPPCLTCCTAALHRLRNWLSSFRLCHLCTATSRSPFCCLPRARHAGTGCPQRVVGAAHAAACSSGAAAPHAAHAAARGICQRRQQAPC